MHDMYIIHIAMYCYDHNIVCIYVIMYMCLSSCITEAATDPVAESLDTVDPLPYALVAVGLVVLLVLLIVLVLVVAILLWWVNYYH